jgi:hypothetical protein
LKYYEDKYNTVLPQIKMVKKDEKGVSMSEKKIVHLKDELAMA